MIKCLTFCKYLSILPLSIKWRYEHDRSRMDSQRDMVYRGVAAPVLKGNVAQAVGLVVYRLFERVAVGL